MHGIFAMNLTFFLISRGVAINLLKDTYNETTPKELDNILFHFNPRPNNIIVLNTHSNGSWQKEERISTLKEKETFIQKEFTLEIKVKPSKKAGSWIGVLVNRKFLSDLQTKSDITETGWIEHSPCISIIGVQQWKETEEEEQAAKD